MPTWAKATVATFAAVVAISAATGGLGCDYDSNDDCVPRADVGGSVRVGDLTWKVEGVRTAAQFGEPGLLGPEKAAGRFVVVTVRVHADKQATLLGDAFALQTASRTYDLNPTGALGLGAGAFSIIERLGPGADETWKLVFDVPVSALSAKKVEVRFNEVDSGSARGYIDISAQLRRN